MSLPETENVLDCVACVQPGGSEWGMGVEWCSYKPQTASELRGWEGGSGDSGGASLQARDWCVVGTKHGGIRNWMTVLRIYWTFGGRVCVRGWGG